MRWRQRLAGVERQRARRPGRCAPFLSLPAPPAWPLLSLPNPANWPLRLPYLPPPTLLLASAAGGTVLSGRFRALVPGPALPAVGSAAGELAPDSPSVLTGFRASAHALCYGHTLPAALMLEQNRNDYMMQGNVGEEQLLGEELRQTAHRVGH